MKGRIPKRLKKDPIVEALCELRFDSEESSNLPELVVSRLADFSLWSGASLRRLPIADFPAQAREQDPNLRDQPIMELRSGTSLGKIGPHVISYHVLAPYVGWEEFQPAVAKMASSLLDALEGVSVRRIGLRYVNLLKADHGVTSVNDLECSISVGGESLHDSLNLNYRKASERCSCLVRIATPDFVRTTTEEPFAVLLDLDVASNGDFTFSTEDQILDYLEHAHDFEKERFFEVLPDALLKSLTLD